MSSFESWNTRNYERTDEQKKPAIEVGAPPKNITITYGIWLIEPGGFLARLVRVMEEELKPKA